MNVEERFVKKEDVRNEICKMSKVLIKPLDTAPWEIKEQAILVPIVDIVKTNEEIHINQVVIM